MRLTALVAAILFGLCVTARSQETLYGLGGPLDFIDPQTGVKHQVLPSPVADLQFHQGCAFGGSRLYAIAIQTAVHPAQLVSFHPADGKVKVLGPTDQGLSNNHAIEWDPTTGKIYAAEGDELYVIDSASGATIWLGPVVGIKPNDCICGLAIDSQGNAFATGRWPVPSLYQVDTTSLTAVHLGDLPMGGLGGGADGFTDLAFDSAGRLWGSFDGSSQVSGGLFVIDPSTLQVTRVVQVSPLYPYLGIAFGPACNVTPYCTPKTDSIGCVPAISAEGLASPNAVAGFTVGASNVRNRAFGALFWSASGRAFLPFGGGALCLASPLMRTKRLYGAGGSMLPVRDCTGVWQVDLNALMTSGTSFPPGTTLTCQWIGRDAGFAPPDAVTLTDAIEVVLCP